MSITFLLARLREPVSRKLITRTSFIFNPLSQIPKITAGAVLVEELRFTLKLEQEMWEMWTSKKQIKQNNIFLVFHLVDKSGGNNPN